jgi:WD40 repeat protein
MIYRVYFNPTDHDYRILKKFNPNVKRSMYPALLKSGFQSREDAQRYINEQFHSSESYYIGPGSSTDPDYPLDRSELMGGSNASNTRQHLESQQSNRRWLFRLLLFVAGLAAATFVGILIYNQLTAISVTNVTLPLLRTLSDPKGAGWNAQHALGAVAFSPNGKILAAGEVDEPGIYLWDTADGKLAATLSARRAGTMWGSNMSVTTLAFSPNGNTLAVGIGGSSFTHGATYLVDTATGRTTATFADPGSRGVTQVAYSPNGKTIAIADGNGSTYLWDVVTGHITAIIESGGDVGAAYSPDGRTLATVGGSGIDLWDSATGRRTATLTGASSGDCPSIAYSPNGKTIASSAGIGSIHLWDITTRQITYTFTVPNTGQCGTDTYSPNGKTLVISGGNGNAYLWDIATKRMTSRLTDPDNFPVGAMTYSSNGRTLATVDQLGHVYLWDTITH